MGEAGVRVLAAFAALLCLASCAAPPATPSRAPPRAAPSATPSPLPPEPAPPAPLRLDDQCGAVPLQSLVGKPETEIPIPLEPGHRRVVCTTCPMIEDYRPDRQTIFFDAATGLVTAVKCG